MFSIDRSNHDMNIFQKIGCHIEDGADKAARLFMNAYTKIDPKEENLGTAVTKTVLVVSSILALFLQPIGTVIGFVVGLVLRDSVKNAEMKTREWFNESSPLLKGLAVTGAVLGMCLTPVGGLANGAYWGSTLAQMMKKPQPFEV